MLKASAKNKLKFADIEKIKKRFLLLNRERLRRSEDCMRANQRDFLEFLPLLFHVNHPRLPGYVSKSSPCGICDYAPSNKAMIAANRHISNFEYTKRAMPRYDIMSMFLMGSSGTVAYSKKSDFDIWLCHQHDVKPDRLVELQAKATAIEEWADAQGLEVHFFLMDAKKFKQGKIVDLSSESSGTAQYYLLLEEFYRTGLLLAGRFPVWWLVPPNEESNYDAYVKKLYNRRLVSEGEVVDFGGIPSIPAEEFFGAALWQLFKGIDSPYKSVLKLLLMEVYAAEYPDIELLCMRFKQAIFDGENDLDRLDPYLMLYRKLEEYLRLRGEEGRLDLVRRCFYFKVNQRLSAAESQQYDWRRDLLRGMTNAWGWEKKFLKELDDRSNWKIRKVSKERSVLVKELTYTYQFLSNFARNHAQLAAINQQDLNALGRKLYAAFERKTGKVEIINRGISQNVRESVLTFYQINQEHNNGGWALLADNELGEPEQFASQVDPSAMVAIKRGRHVVELISWAYFNGLMTGATAIKVIQNTPQLEAREVQECVRGLEPVMPVSKVLETDIDDLGKAVRILNSTIILNMGIDSMSVHRRAGSHLASNRTDAFSYGGMYESLVDGCDQIVLTSWKEVVTSHYEGVEGLLACLSNYFRIMPPSKGAEPPAPAVLCYTLNHAITIRQRVERLISELTHCFYGSVEKLSNQYVFGVQRAYYIVYFESDIMRFQKRATFADLLHSIGKGRESFGRIKFDKQVVSDPLLPLVFKFNKPNVVQFFYKAAGRKADIYVVDEYGSLHTRKLEFYDEERLLGHYHLFFDSILQRQLFEIIGHGDEVGDEIAVEYYQVGRDRQGQLQVGRRIADDHIQHGYLSIQVIASRDEASGSVFSIYCDDQEFSSVEYGSELFNEVAKHILSKRERSQSYPVYITDLDLSADMFPDYKGGHVPTVEYLNYKKNIENHLNIALEGLAKTHPLPPRSID